MFADSLSFPLYVAFVNSFSCPWHSPLGPFSVPPLAAKQAIGGLAGLTAAVPMVNIPHRSGEWQAACRGGTLRRGKNAVVEEKEGFGTEKEPASLSIASKYQLAMFFLPVVFYFF